MKSVSVRLWLFAIAVPLLLPPPLLIGAAAAVAQPASSAFDAGWATYKSRFVTADGRVLDTGNNAVSHTEGQGFAMLFAEADNDRESFDRVWNWTRTNLQRRDNGLFSWRYNPDDRKTPVADRNDASDGDILIAWALIRADRRWHDPDYDRAARHVVEEIKRRLLVSASGRLVLLPGATGFKGKDGNTVVNPSYYIFPALNDFARLVPSPEWQRLNRAGLALLADARFGRWGLTPDWVDLDRDEIAPASRFPPRFGFDAIRIPLYLIWGGQATPARLASFLDFWNDYGTKPAPAWTDVMDNSVAPYPGSTGYQAVVALARGFGQSDQATPLPTIGDKDDYYKDDYYAASLTLLAALARSDTAR